MALHMVDDPQDQQDDYNDNSGGGGGNRPNFPGGGGGGLLSLLPLLLGLFRGGKGMIVLLLLAVGGYFLFKNGGCSNVASVDTIQKLFSQSGYSFNPNEFKKASVYEGLEDDNGKNPLPESVSLLKFAPPRLNQGQQGSCVAWSSAYAARTILESSSTLQDPNQVAYSPAFLYNNIALDDCQGSYIQRAMEFMSRTGALHMEDFKYDDQDCSRQASNSLVQKAGENRIHGFTRLTESDGVNGISIRAIKEHLAKDAPVVIGMMVGGSFMQEMMGQRVWHPNDEDRQQMGFGGHAMCVIGYDDRVEGGAFQIMNSWGPEWGQNGVAYVRYADFAEFVREAYGLDPLPKRGAALNVAFECNIGLWNPETKQNIPLQAGAGNVFKTINPIQKGSKFKIELKNAVECYAYIFTPDVQGKSFVLFPYKPIHSPYFGITGYRLFPRKESIQADSIGNKEYMAIVVSKQPLDYNALNDAINSSSKTDFVSKLNDAVASNMIRNVGYSSGTNNSIYFKVGNANENGVVACIVEIDKQ
ncbi:MAG: C1 family peptidase [Ferruginibacter sp.]